MPPVYRIATCSRLLNILTQPPDYVVSMLLVGLLKSYWALQGIL